MVIPDDLTALFHALSENPAVSPAGWVEDWSYKHLPDGFVVREGQTLRS